MSLARQLEEAIADGAELNPSDDEWLAVAAEIAKADSKNRFSVDGVRRAFAAKNGAQYVKIKDERARPDRLVRARKIVADKVKPFFRIAKATKGVGIEFRPAGGDRTEIIKDGDVVGEIIRGEGEFQGATRQRGVEFHIDLWDDSAEQLPSGFDSMSDAKKWATAHL
jgi:hypothetical protein